MKALIKLNSPVLSGNQFNIPGVPKNPIDLKKLLHKLFQIKNTIIIFSKSTIIRLNFDIFFRIFCDLTAEL